MTPTTEQPAAPRKLRRIESKAHGQCAWCGREIFPGDSDYVIDGVKGYYCTPECAHADAKLNGTQLDCDYGANDAPPIQSGTPPTISPYTQSVEVEAAFERGYTQGFKDGRKSA